MRAPLKNAGLALSRASSFSSSHDHIGIFHDYFFEEFAHRDGALPSNSD
jgi:hypothetical protein